MNRRLAAGLCALALGAGGVVLGTGAPASAKEGKVACEDIQLGHQPPFYETSAASPVIDQMGIEQAHEWLREHGRGLGDVGVAVVDSGVSTAEGRIPVTAKVGSGSPAYYHGTAVAGLIAGKPRGDEPTGIAPDARIIDAQFYDDPDGEGREVTNDNLAAALQGLLARQGSFDIVNISVKLGPDPQVERLIDELTARGKIVVAAAGNRDDQSTYQGGEDAATSVFPAGYDGVVAAGAQIRESGSDGVDAGSMVLANSAIAVSAPTAGAISYGVTGESCELAEPATSWAAAEVSGVLALLRSAFPDDTAAQVISRLELTASGRVDVRGTFTGAGMVQPMEAFTRPLELSRDGEVDFSRQVASGETPALPATEDDLLAVAKKSSVWWGIIGGGALLVAVLLRPLFARRR